MVFLSRSVELTAQWNRILAIGPLYHGCENNYSFDALQAYCFGINIKL